MNANRKPKREVVAQKGGTQLLGALVVLAMALISPLRAATDGPVPTLQINADQTGAHVSPMLYGLMTEEINYSYEGGLYAELIVNRTFKENPQSPVWWHLVQDGGGAGSMSLDTNQPLNAALTTSLRLEASQVSGNQRVGIANEGYWGIPVKPNTRYRTSFYAKAGARFTGPLTVAIVSTKNETIYASAQVGQITGEWKEYKATLGTGKVAPTQDAQFVIWTGKSGTIWFSHVSLFPPTWKDRPNGNRKDIMQLLADMKPAFLRFPGGNYLEGRTIATRFDWKKTVGDISQRPGHLDDAWHYWSTDGMGLLEFLEWCEDLKMQPVVGVYAGYSLSGEQAAAGPDLQPFVQDAIDEIEYITGGAKTQWGAQRARDGHPAPFKLTYVEVGNEENLGRAGGTYDARFTQFFDGIKSKYPHLKIIAAVPSSTRILKTRAPDVFDDHFYRNSTQMWLDTHHYDKTDRNGPKIFVGEWATREGTPTPIMNAALADAAWLTGLERNADAVIMSSYAPLFVNVNPGGMQWPTDLIGYDALTSYGSPSYYVQKMFSLNHGDVILPVNGEGIPTHEMQAPGRRGGPPPPPQQVPTLAFNATRDTATGMIFLKVVNGSGTALPVRVEIKGVTSVAPEGQSVVLAADSPQDTNSITEPAKVVPVIGKEGGLGTSFMHTFPKYSVTVLLIKGR
jgi:alpha-N-arabinofuranosidase